jgi:hypothetical protein
MEFYFQDERIETWKQFLPGRTAPVKQSLSGSASPELSAPIVAIVAAPVVVALAPVAV